MPKPRTLIAGNWKMNGLRASLPELAAMKTGIAGVACDVNDGRTLGQV